MSLDEAARADRSAPLPERKPFAGAQPRSWTFAGVLACGALACSLWLALDAHAPVPEMSPDLAARYEQAFAEAHSRLMPVDLSTETRRHDVAKSIPSETGRASEIVADALAGGRLVRVLADWCPPFAGYHLYYPSRRQPSAAFAAVVEALRYKV